MDSVKPDVSLGNAFASAAFFALLAWGLSEIPTNSWPLKIISALMFLFMVILNWTMLLGLTTLKYENTQVFYSLALPVSPVLLIADNLVGRYEWWHYIVIIMVVVFCSGILKAMFEFKVFVRSVECIATILLLFISPFLYGLIP